MSKTAKATDNFLDGDRRIRKTKQAVHTALLSLMEEKDISAITVTELAQKADVNRKTFYNHYCDINAVLDEIGSDCVDRFSDIMTQGGIQDFIEDPSMVFTALMKELEANDELHRLLNLPGAQEGVIKKIAEAEKQLLAEMTKKQYHVDSIWLDYLVGFITSGVATIINDWFRTKDDIPIEDMSHFLTILFSSVDYHQLLKLLGGHENSAEG